MKIYHILILTIFYATKSSITYLHYDSDSVFIYAHPPALSCVRPFILPFTINNFKSFKSRIKHNILKNHRNHVWTGSKPTIFTEQKYCYCMNGNFLYLYYIFYILYVFNIFIYPEYMILEFFCIQTVQKSYLNPESSDVDPIILRHINFYGKEFRCFWYFLDFRPDPQQRFCRSRILIREGRELLFYHVFP